MTSQQETLRREHSAADPTVSRAGLPKKADSGPVRSEPVFLELPVKVHGSRVVEVVRGTTSHTQPFEEQTATMIVFPNGGVVRMTTAVNAGQAVVLTNLKSGQDAIGRVAKVRPCGNKQAYVEVEFTKPQAGFWGVDFLSKGPELEAKTVCATPPAAPPSAPAASSPGEGGVNEKVVPVVTPASVSPASIPVSTHPAPSGHAQSANPPSLPSPAFPSDVRSEKRPSAFVSIGESEDVQPAADDTSGPQGDRFGTNGKSSAVADAPKAVAPAPAKSPAGNQPAAFASSAGEASFGRLQSASPGAFDTFGTRLGGGTFRASGQIEEPRRNWVMMAGCVALVLAAVGGGAEYYFHAHLAAEPPAIPATVAPAPPAEPAAGQVSALQPPTPTLPPNPAPDAAASPVEPASGEGARGGTSGVSIRSSSAASGTPSKTPGVLQRPPDTPPKQKVRAALPDMSGALKAHPVTSRRRRAGESAAAPSLDAGAALSSQGGTLAGVGGSPVILSRPPQTIPGEPVSVGGEVKPPRVISSVQPIYPSIARQARVEGNVVVRIVIDKTGNVVDAKAISGPEMLRGAAVDALRQWKYEASRLNGEAISVQMLVTIQFRR